MQELVIGSFISNLLVAMLWAYGVFTILETSPKWSLPFGLGTGIPYIGLLYWIGETILTVTVSEMKWLIIAAVLGAVGGIGLIVTVFKPETS